MKKNKDEIKRKLALLVKTAKKVPQLEALVKTQAELITLSKDKEEYHTELIAGIDVLQKSIEKIEIPKPLKEVKSEITNFPKEIEIKKPKWIKEYNDTEFKELVKGQISTLGESLGKKEDNSAWSIAQAIMGAFQGIVEFLSKAVIRTTLPKEHYEMPQKVVVWDPSTGKYVDFQEVFKQEFRPMQSAFVALGPETAGAIKDQLEYYKISDVDESGDPKYYGFQTKEGYWYILKNTNGTTYRYAVGIAGYATAWTNRASQDYGYFADKF